jgi:hypothetical protein
MDPELGEVIRSAVARALQYWKGSEPEAEDDLVQDLYVWYLARPSVQRRYAETEFVSKRRELFYRAAMQQLSAVKLQDNAFAGRDLYSASAVRAALTGESTNKYLMSILPSALDDLGRQNSKYREAIRSRYEDGISPGTAGPAKDRLYHALTALTAHCNVTFITQEDETKTSSTLNPDGRRASGRYSDPTADLALGLIQGGDTTIELHDGSTTTYREEIMQDTLDRTVARTDAQASPIGMPEGVFDPGFIGQDRADMYRAAVFPELFDEKPMLIQNWSAEDREAYCGGEYTPGYRRLSLVK